MKTHLTPEQKIELELSHKSNRDKRFCDRIKAVLLSSEGWSAKMIGQALRIHEETVLQHLRDYRESEKLTIQSGGKESYLNPEQTDELVMHMADNIYASQKDIVKYVEATYKIKFSISGMTKWLSRNGFVYKKAKPIPHKFDPLAQQKFKEYYSQLKQNLPKDEHILFIDAVHPTQATKLSYGWIKKGKDKTIETSGSKTRLNLVGAIELNSIKNTIVNEYETVNAESIISFLTTVRSQYLTGNLHIILDGAGYHRAHKLVEAAEKLNIKLHYLPPYSPNLNPIERLWKVMNEYVRNNKYFPTTKDFRQNILKFFNKTLPDIGNTLTSRINDNFQTLQKNQGFEG